MIEGLPVKRGGHNPVQLFCREIFLHVLRAHRLVAHERAGGNNTVSNGLSDNGFQLDGQVDDCSGSEVTFRPEIQIILVNERTVQRRKRNIGELVLRLQESFDMAIGIAIGSQASYRTVYPHTLFKVADEPPEISQKRFLPACHSKQYAFHLFGRHTVTDSRLFHIDIQCHRTYLIQPVVDFLCRHAFSGSASRRPAGLRDFYLHTECRFGIFSDIQLCHYGAIPVGIHLALFQVERHLYICLVHNQFLCLQNYYMQSK